MLQYQDRNAYAGGDDRESGKGVAHHHGQHRHTDSVDRHGDKAVIDRQILLGQMRDRSANAGDGKQQTQRGEDLRQNERPADRIQQAPRFLHRLQRLLMGHFHRDRQTDQAADGHREQRDQRRVVTAAEHRALQRRNVVEQQHTDHRHHRDRQCGDKQLVAQTLGAGLALLRRSLMIAAEAHTAEAGDQGHHHHHPANDDVQHAFLVTALAQYVAQQAVSPVADQEYQAVQPPKQPGGDAARVGAIAEGHHRHNQQHRAGQPVKILLLEIHRASPFACSAA